MRHAIFAVPFALDNTIKFVRIAAQIPDLRLAVVSQDPIQRFPEELQQRLAGFVQVRDAMNPRDLADGARRIAKSFGGRLDQMFGILEQLQVPLAEARAMLGLPGLSVEAATNFRDKAQMKDVLRAADLPCAKHELAHSPQDAIRFGETCGYPLVVKPPAGAGGKSTFRVENRGELESAMRQMPPHPQNPVLLEEFMQGEEFSFDTVTVDGQHVFHSISCYSPTPLEVMETPWIQWNVLLPRDVSGPEFEPIRDAGPRALDALGMSTGMTHMEWFRRHDGSIAISEVAARPPGAQFMTLISYAHDLDFYRAWADLMAGGAFHPPERRWATGAAYLRAQGHGARIVDVKGLDRAQQELGDLVVEASLPQPGQPPSTSYEGEGYVVLRDEDTEVVANGLRRLVELLRVELG